MEHRTNPTSQSGVHLELCVRSLAESAEPCRLDGLIDAAESLVAEDWIDSFDTTVWGDQLPLDRPPRTDTGRAMCQLLGEFEDWAAESNRSIRPFFQTRSITSELISHGEEREVMSLPDMAIAEFHEGSLEWVSPHRVNNSVHSIQDHLSAIASGTPARASVTDQRVDGDAQHTESQFNDQIIDAE